MELNMKKYYKLINDIKVKKIKNQTILINNNQ